MENNIEKDIKTVEERVETLNRHIKNYEKIDCKTEVYQGLIKERSALENILELVKDKTIHLSDEEYRQVIENAQKDIKQKYEDKIKNKIEEVEDVLDMCKADGNVARYKMQQLEEEIEDLEELLEDK